MSTIDSGHYHPLHHAGRAVTPDAYAAWDCERVFIDTPKTQREEQRRLFMCLRKGDTLFMFSKGELGHGAELPLLRKILSDYEVTIEYPAVAPDRRGRSKGFDPTPEDDKYLKIMWKDQTYSQAYCLRAASERTGTDVKRHQLIYRYGKRTD